MASTSNVQKSPHIIVTNTWRLPCVSLIQNQSTLIRPILSMSNSIYMDGFERRFRERNSPPLDDFELFSSTTEAQMAAVEALQQEREEAGTRREEERALARHEQALEFAPPEPVPKSVPQPPTPQQQPVPAAPPISPMTTEDSKSPATSQTPGSTQAPQIACTRQIPHIRVTHEEGNWRGGGKIESDIEMERRRRKLIDRYVSRGENRPWEI
jgi:hypothetical protein